MKISLGRPSGMDDFARGALLIVASELMFSSMGATVKALSEALPSETIVFLRNLLGMCVLLPLIVREGFSSLATRVPQLHLLRALAGVSAMYCFFYALGRLPLADGMLLKMTAPIFMPVVALLWLHERVSWLGLLAVPVGFVGVLLVLDPGGAVNEAALVGLLGGLLAAVAKVTVRRLTRTEPASRIVFYFAVLATVVSAFPLGWGWRAPQGTEWVLLVLVALTGTLGQLLLTRGYAAAPTARVSPFTYFSVVFGAVYGYLFWGEVLTYQFVLGACLIASAGVVALRAREPSKPAAAVQAAGNAQ